MARTPLFDSVKRALPITRRRFLGLAATAAACAATPKLSRQPGRRIAIVGAGAAGLMAARVLARLGMEATVYEASDRAGGRIVSARELFGPGLTVELGGEFIDSTHERMLALAKELDLRLLDSEADRVAIDESYFFGGQHHGENDLAEALVPLATRIQADVAQISPDVDYRNEGNARALDTKTMAEYFDSLGLDVWLRGLLDVAFVGEFGLETGDQSALNFLFLVSGETGLF